MRTGWEMRRGKKGTIANDDELPPDLWASKRPRPVQAEWETRTGFCADMAGAEARGVVVVVSGAEDVACGGSGMFGCGEGGRRERRRQKRGAWALNDYVTGRCRVDLRASSFRLCVTRSLPLLSFLPLFSDIVCLWYVSNAARGWRGKSQVARQSCWAMCWLVILASVQAAQEPPTPTLLNCLPDVPPYRNPVFPAVRGPSATPSFLSPRSSPNLSLQVRISASQIAVL